MPDGMTRIETYISEIEAEIAKGRLEALGVQVLLTRDNCGGMGPQFNLQQGVRLHIADQDLEKAREILTLMKETAPGPAWNCGKCAMEIEGNFDTCWNCGTDRPLEPA